MTDINYNRNAVFAKLCDDTIESSFAEIAASVPETPIEIRQDALDWIRATRQHFISVMRDVDDAQDFAMTLAVRYIELKCHWILLNTHNNYSLFVSGSPNQQSVLRSSLISFLLGSIEPLLRTEDVSRITDFLASPVNQVSL